LRYGSRSFYAASQVLPKQVRRPATALYAFCRLADDAIDCQEGDAKALQKLYRRLDRIYAGKPEAIPADRALARVVREFDIPQSLPAALLEGFAWDLEQRSYATLSELNAYAARAAGSVGVMMAMIMGVRHPEALARAGDLGVAMQLTNIARDVGEDARNGRIYLPREWLHEAGVDAEQWLSDPIHTPMLGALVERLLAEADTLYQRSRSGLSYLPAGCRPGINAARLIYAEIGVELRRLNHDSINHRAVVPTARKLVLLGRSVAAGIRQRTRDMAPPLQENRFLVEAVTTLAGDQ
jgi:phytoene synthase